MKSVFILLMSLSCVGLAYAGEPLNTDYESVIASQTDQTIGPVGASGDILERLVVSVNTAASGTVSIRDGSADLMQITTANTPIGVYSVILGARSKNGAWKVTTGAGASVIAVGRFK